MAITQPITSEGTADTLSGTTHADTGIVFIQHGADKNDSPKLRTRLTQQQVQINRLLNVAACGAVFSREDGLKVCVKGIPYYRIGGTTYTLPDDDEFTVTDDKTMYLYCDDSETVEQSDGAWPGTDHIKLAVVTTASGAVTSVKSALLENHTIGLDNYWSTIAATQEVDMAGFGFGDLGALKWEHADATVASGVLAVGSYGVLSVKGEGDAADVIDTINSDTDDEVRLLLLRRYSAATGDILLTHEVDNISLLGGKACELADNTHWVLLAKWTYDVGTDYWSEIARHATDHYSDWVYATNANGLPLTDLGVLAFDEETKTLASDILTLGSKTFTLVDTEGGGATDDLDEIILGSGTWGDADTNGLLVLRPANDARTVVVKHDNVGGAGKAIHLQNGVDFTMDTVKHTLVLRYDATNDYFVEVARSPTTLATLEATEACIASPIPFYWPGTITVKAFEQEYLIPVDGWIRTATGRVVTAPVADPCYIDVQLNEGGGYGSIFGADATKIHIPATEFEDTATVLDPWQEVSAGDRLRIACVTTAGAAEDLSVLVDFRTKVQAPE